MARWYLDENIHLASLSEILNESNKSSNMFVVNRNWIRTHIYGRVDIFEKEKGDEWQSGICWTGEHCSLLYVSDYRDPLRDVIDYYRNRESPKTTEFSNLNVGFL